MPALNKHNLHFDILRVRLQDGIANVHLIQDEIELQNIENTCIVQNWLLISSLLIVTKIARHLRCIKSKYAFCLGGERGGEFGGLLVVSDFYSYMKDLTKPKTKVTYLGNEDAVLKAAEEGAGENEAAGPPTN